MCRNVLLVLLTCVVVVLAHDLPGHGRRRGIPVMDEGDRRRGHQRHRRRDGDLRRLAGAGAVGDGRRRRGSRTRGPALFAAAVVPRVHIANHQTALVLL